LKATIIIPTFDHCELIKFPIESILRQTHQNFELFVIGDGAPDRTEQIVNQYAQTDSRIQYFKHNKGPRLGEAYRHPILSKATGDFVCYLADDDLYLDNHLALMAEELRKVDFTHSLPNSIMPDGSPHVWLIDLSLQWYHNLLLSGTNRLPLGMVGHRMDFYRKLPEGWRTTPIGVPTDLYMWQQFLSQQQIRCSSLLEITALHFASPERKHLSLEERYLELEAYFNLIKIPENLKELKTRIYSAQLRTALQLEINKSVVENEKIDALQIKLNNKNLHILRLESKIEDLSQQIVTLQAETSSRAYQWCVRLREFLRKIKILELLKNMERKCLKK
jgi:GalNAc5-diNAcBac-PP-undecaprenol beta-1,3-glucosyltransferase